MLSFGKCLCSKSGLSSGTLMEHLRAIFEKSGTIVGGDIELIEVKNDILIVQVPTELSETPATVIETEEMTQIIETKDELNGIC